MKKKGVSLILIISIIALASITIYSKTNSNHKIKEDKLLITKMQSAIEISALLDLKTITDFQWDEVYIITPHK